MILICLLDQQEGDVLYIFTYCFEYSCEVCFKVVTTFTWYKHGHDENVIDQNEVHILHCFWLYTYKPSHMVIM